MFFDISGVGNFQLNTYCYFMNKKECLSDSNSVPVKRYCQTLQLKNDQELIEKYIQMHHEDHHWKIIRDGIRAVGILNMEIYLSDNKLFMIVDAPLDFEWHLAFEKLKKMPLQEEWEKEMSIYQDSSGGSSMEKWQLMDRIFYLYE